MPLSCHLPRPHRRALRPRCCLPVAHSTHSSSSFTFPSLSQLLTFQKTFFKAKKKNNLCVLHVYVGSSKTQDPDQRPLCLVLRDVSCFGPITSLESAALSQCEGPGPLPFSLSISSQSLKELWICLQKDTGDIYFVFSLWFLFTLGIFMTVINK